MRVIRSSDMAGTSDSGEQSALDMRITKAGVDKIPLARIDKRGREEWDDHPPDKGIALPHFLCPKMINICNSLQIKLVALGGSS